MTPKPRLPIDRAHLVGIGGAGVSALARLLQGLGVEVSGSDLKDSVRLENLRRLGIPIRVGHEHELPPLGNGWVVHSAAVPSGNRELAEARRRGWKVLNYAQAVGRLSRNLKTLAVSGTHGKTSTTAMTVTALCEAGIDPSYLIGGDVALPDGNGHAGGSDYFVVEACEFNRSFHHLLPRHAVILNLERDHFDCYPDEETLVESFAEFAHGIQPEGSLFVDEGLPHGVMLHLPEDLEVLTVGEGLFADLRPVDLVERRGKFAFTPKFRGEHLPRIELEVAGRFQVTNALFALGLALKAGADPRDAARGLSKFQGVARRFQLHIGPKGGLLIDDFAHHPSEVRAVLKTARAAFPDRRLLVVFQPHQFSRTRHLCREFADALKIADHCYVTKIYPAREDPDLDHGIGPEDLVACIREAGGTADPAGEVGEFAGNLLERLGPEDLPMILGAGDVDGLVAEVVRNL